MFRLIKNLPFIVGGSLLSYHFVNISIDSYNHFKFSPADYRVAYGEGSYCLITNPSQGLGLSLADEFASKGFNLLLLEKNYSNLQKLKKELSEKHKISIDIVTLDLSSARFENYESLRQILKDFDISVLVNNSTSAVDKKLVDHSLSSIREVFYAKSLAPTLLSNILIPSFRQRANKSTILNVNLDLIPENKKATVLDTSTNGFSDHLSQSLSLELKTNLNVVSAKIGPLGSPNQNMSFVDKWFFCKEEEVAKELVRKMELDKPVIYGTLRHGLYQSVYRDLMALRKYNPFVKGNDDAPQFG